MSSPKKISETSFCNLSGQITLITGASGGIGLAITRLFLMRGAKVYAHYYQHRKPLEPLLHEFSQEKLELVQADLQAPGAPKLLVKTAISQTGKLHILVNNAGIIHDNLLALTEPEEFQKLLSINYLAAVACTKASIRPMLKQRFGRIINITSIAAHLPGKGQSNYAASKGALRSFSQALAAELGPKGITVNTIAPGVIETKMSQEILSLAKKEILARTAVGRIGTPEDIAGAVLYLASKEAGFITGQALRVDGGFKLR